MRALYLIIAILLAVVPVAFAQKQQAPSISQQLLSQYPMSVLVSSDGKRVLVKTRAAQGFELKVLALDTGKVLARSVSPETQLALAWNAAGTKIAYLEPMAERGSFGLTIWDLTTNKIHKNHGLRTNNAAVPLRWSETQDKLAMVLSMPDEPTLYVESQIAKVKSDAPFAFSPSADQIAFIPANENSIAVKSLTQPDKKYDSIPLTEGDTIKDLDWSPDGTQLLAAIRSKSDEYYSLRKIDLATKQLEQLDHGRGDIRHPQWHPNGREYFFERVNGGTAELLRKSFSGDLAVIGDTSSNRRILRLAENNKKLFFHQLWTTHPPELAAYDLDTQKIETFVNLKPSIVAKYPLTPQELVIKGADGLDIPMLLWKPQLNKPQKALLIVHGGPRLLEVSDWDAKVQIAVDRGFVVASPNYRGSKGYGRTFENSGDITSRADDIIAAAKYLNDNLGIRSEQIAALASSYGSYITLEAFKKSPKFIGLALIQSFYAPDDVSCVDVPIHIFQGARDAIAPVENAQNYAKRCFTSTKKGRLTIFEGEGHGFHRTASWVEILAALVGS